MASKTLIYLALPMLLAIMLVDSGRAQQSELPACPNASTAKYNNCIRKWSDGHGTTYVGEWSNGNWNGRGTITFPGGAKYVGEFKNGKADGQGTLIFGQGPFKGDQYVGEFKEDAREGQGTYTRANGDKQAGQWQNGKPNGQGTETLATGKRYVGEFKDGKPSGQGTETWANGDKYVGEFKDGKRNGQGTYTYASGKKYVGEFKNDKKNGHGILYTADGSILAQGIYTNDKLKSAETALPHASANSHRVQLVKEGGIYTVPVLINGVLMLHFIVDSGAADVTIPADVAMTLIRTGTIKEGDFIGSQKYQLADGSIIDSAQFTLRSLKVGDQIIENVRCSIGDTKGSLLLGQSFLEKFKSWSMDNASHELVLE